MRSHSIFSIRKLWLLRNSPVAPLTRKAIAHLGAELPAGIGYATERARWNLGLGFWSAIASLSRLGLLGDFRLNLTKPASTESHPRPNDVFYSRFR